MSLSTLAASLPTWVPSLSLIAQIGLGIFLALYSYGLFFALRRRYHRAQVATIGKTTPPLAISVLKPLHGLDPDLARNLESFAALKSAGPLEVLLLIDTADDEAAPLARQMVEKHPERFRLFIGKRAQLSNPKIASLAHGLTFAKHPFIWVSDSNVETEDAHLAALVATWHETQAMGPTPALIHSPLAAVGGTGLGARFERLHLAPYNNGNHEVCLIGGVHAVVGKSLFMRQDHLREVGGFEAYGDYGGEDFQLGIQFARIGIVRCAPIAARQRLGHYTWRHWLSRQRRWAVVRRSMSPVSYTFGEHFTYLASGLLPALCGFLPWSWLGVALAFKAAGDAAFYYAATGEWLRPLDIVVLPLKEVFLLIAWIQGFVAREVTWRGRRLTVGKESVYSEI